MIAFSKRRARSRSPASRLPLSPSRITSAWTGSLTALTVVVISSANSVCLSEKYRYTVALEDPASAVISSMLAPA